LIFLINLYYSKHLKVIGPAITFLVIITVYQQQDVLIESQLCIKKILLKVTIYKMCSFNSVTILKEYGIFHPPTEDWGNNGC